MQLFIVSYQIFFSELIINDKYLSVVVDLCFLFCRDRAYSTGKAMCERLKDSIPRQMFEIAVQAAIGSKVIARET